MGPRQQRKGRTLGISTLADGLTRGAERISGTISEAFFEPVIRIGVTGLARAGKTVFITSLVANLLERGRMPGLVAASERGALPPPSCNRSPTTPSRVSTLNRTSLH